MWCTISLFSSWFVIVLLICWFNVNLEYLITLLNIIYLNYRWNITYIKFINPKKNPSFKFLSSNFFFLPNLSAVVKLLGEILASPAVDAPRHRHRQEMLSSVSSILVWWRLLWSSTIRAIWLNVLTLVINFSAMMMEVPDLLIDGVASPLVHLIS